MFETTPRLLVISPHLDDAVFGCGASLAGASHPRVCTVFTGCPAQDLHTDWDAQCGFTSALQAMAARIEEDKRALGILGAAPFHLGFLDSQYVPDAAQSAKPTRESIAHALTDAIDEHRPDALLIPLGLFHSDHILVHEAACDAWQKRPGVTCYGYEEGLYRRMSGAVQQRMADLLERGIEATPFNPPLPAPAELQRRHALKHEAVSAYASQLKAFGDDGYDDVFMPERYWQLAPAKDRR
ncbi:MULTISPECIES: PIG-L family deacetylase [unclassified Caballeronia]|uniref:PIG-L deacetylase family protein n=1 Tax=unclassified Caballeronia TaxID=2646786 RepID=UPI0028614FB0|nr:MULTISPECIES: PIG-L family deacetylase [unclassified Caballeronia]MDR5739518.1 PIG-L family deacetylase [Caballeronia sp. LZ016]MDR5807986.1 PIG-L family deacetylase [Caballeronia sp. LZ019]